ncbi:hypothetical protein Tco_1536213 [Tanacetum coccineum]
MSPLPFFGKNKKRKSQTVSQPKPKTHGLELIESCLKKGNNLSLESPPLRRKQHHQMCQRRILIKPKQSPRDKLIIPKIHRETYNSLLRDPILYSVRALPLPKGPHEDKDLERLKPFADMESQTSPVTALLIADAISSPSSFWMMILESKDDEFEAGDEMDEDIQQADKEETQSPKPSKESSTEIPTKEPVSEEHQSPTPHKEQPESSHAKDTDASDSESSSCSETFRPYDNFVPVTERVLV